VFTSLWAKLTAVMFVACASMIAMASLLLLRADTPVPASYIFSEGAVLLVCWLAIVMLIGACVVRFVTRPLQRLTETMERFQSDDFSTESVKARAALPRSRDEIGRLAQSFGAMAKRIEQQMADLRKHDAMRRELFANISHDLRTPLASLMGYLETVSMKRNLSEEEKTRYCEIAMQETRHLTSLVDELLELAKLDAPEAKIVADAFPLLELVETVCTKLALAAAKRGVVLVKDAPWSAALPLVVADPALIERALENLVDNALHHTPVGGSVTISLSGETNAVAVTVSDTGAGIASEDLPHVFERFYRGRQSGSRGGPGTGLGLAIVRRILELHGVSVAVDSRVGAYTRFRFALPLAEDGRSAVTD
jgi:signal transduction histidine kinase